MLRRVILGLAVVAALAFSGTSAEAGCRGGFGGGPGFGGPGFGGPGYGGGYSSSFYRGSRYYGGGPSFYRSSSFYRGGPSYYGGRRGFSFSFGY